MADDTQGILPEYVTSARDRAAATADLVGKLAAGQYNVGDEMRKIINETLDYNKDVIDLRSETLSQYLTEPAVARARYNTPTLPDGSKNPNYIFNPYEANKAIAQDISTKEIPFLSANMLLKERLTDVDKMVEQSVGSYKAVMAANAAAYDAQRQYYNDVLSEFTTEENIKNQREEMALKRAAAARSGAGKTSTGLSTLEKLGVMDEFLKAGQQRVQEAYKLNPNMTREQADEIYANALAGLEGFTGELSDQDTAYLMGQKEQNYGAWGLKPEIDTQGFKYAPEDSFAKPTNFWDNVGGKISDFFGIGSKPVGNDYVDVSNLNINPADFQRGLKNVQNFNNQFDYTGLGY